MLSSDASYRRKHQVIEIYVLCIKGNVKNAEVPAVLVLVAWRIDYSLQAERTHGSYCFFGIVPDITILHGCRWPAGLDCMLLIMQIEAA